MTLHICVLGIDGSGKSTVAAALPAILAAEMNLLAGSAGEEFAVAGPDEDHLAPKFHPDGYPLSARLARRLRRLAKRAVDRRGLYPAFKLAQMLLQDAAARKLARRHAVQVMISDGNLLLSATGRAANYRRPASVRGSQSRPAPGVEDLEAVYRYLIDGTPPAPESQAKLPPLRPARHIARLCRLLGVHGVWLPDAVVFLDLSPKLALARIGSRGRKVDLHENEADLAQAREMYLKTLEAFRRYRGADAVHTIPMDHLSPGEVLCDVVKSLRPRIQARQAEAGAANRPLGTTSVRLSGSAVWSKVFNYRYLVRYLLAKWLHGAWREPFFPFSNLGRLFLKEGYSAGVMRVIYDQDEKRYGSLDRIFLGYPLHRAVYDRLQILTRRIEGELEARLNRGRQVRILTAPSGFSYDLFRPLASIAARAPQRMAKVEIIAADLDPQGVLADELGRRAARLGLQLLFFRGNLTAADIRAQLGQRAPYDLALFVGLSSWLPKPQAVAHLRWLREHLRDDGLLITDCFTADAYALSGRYVGYKAQYYTPENYRALLDYCGFDGLSAAVESGRDAINHMLLATPRLSPDRPAALVSEEAQRTPFGLA